VAKFWRHSPGHLLVISAMLNVLLVAYTRTAGATLNAGVPIGRQLVQLAIVEFLTWRVSKRGRVAWALLMLLNGSLIALVPLGAGGAPWRDPYLLGLLIMWACQLILLASPAVRSQVRSVPPSIP
jgi:hypothetical protein